MPDEVKDKKSNASSRQSVCPTTSKELSDLTPRNIERPGRDRSLESDLAMVEYYLGNDRLEEAEHYLLEILDRVEHNATLHNQLGVVYFKQAQFRKAEYHFKRALQLDFGEASAHFNLATLYQTQGKFKSALPHYKEVLNSCPDDPQIYYLMGQCAQCAGMLQEAEAFFVESFSLSPSREVAIELSTLYISMGKYPSAEEVLNFLIRSRDADQSLSDNEDKSILHFTMGLVLKKQEKYIPAIKHFREVVMMDDNNEQAFNHLGECCLAIGLYNEAESFFAKASKLDPDYLQPILNLGKLYYTQEKFYKATVAMERYVELRLMDVPVEEKADVNDPELEFAYKILGQSYMQLGEKEKARKALERLNPQNSAEIVSLMEDVSEEQGEEGKHAGAYKRVNLPIDD